MKVEHCKSRPLIGASSDTTYSVNGKEISYDYSWPFFLLKHLKYDPSGHLSLSVGLMLLLRNSILQHKLFSEPVPWAEAYRDFALPTKEARKQQASMGEDIERDPVKEPVLETEQVRDPFLQNEPTGQISFAIGGKPSRVEDKEQPNSDIVSSHFLTNLRSGSIWETSLVEPPPGIAIGLVEPHPRRGKNRFKSKLRLL